MRRCKKTPESGLLFQLKIKLHDGEQKTAPMAQKNEPSKAGFGLRALLLIQFSSPYCVAHKKLFLTYQTYAAS
jgi:hypothetical protein